jgi:hypothetical protein
MHDLPVLRFMQVMQVMQVMLAKHERPTTRNKSKNQGLAAGEMKRISPAWDEKDLTLSQNSRRREMKRISRAWDEKDLTRRALGINAPSFSSEH